jgi:hypothetical protein
MTNFNNINSNASNILLHVSESGGLGDISQLFLVAQKIKNLAPEARLTLVINLSRASEERIKKLFPVQDYTVIFFSGGNILSSENQERLSRLVSQSQCILGVALPCLDRIMRPQEQYPNSFMLWEYGRFSCPNSYESSMGFSPDKECGVLLPVIESTPLSDLETPWLREALQGFDTFYFMYVAEDTIKIFSNYTLANIEKEKPTPFAVFLPGLPDLKQLIETNGLDTQALAQCGIGRLTYITKQGMESIEIGSSGKEMRILGDNIPHKDAMILLQHSQPFSGCTGDVSWSEAIAAGKSVLYDRPHHKKLFHNSCIAVQESHQLRATEQIQKMMRNLVNIIEEKEWLVWDRADPSSLLSAVMPLLTPLFLTSASDLANLYQTQKDVLIQEAAQFRDIVLKEHNAEKRIYELLQKTGVCAPEQELH